MTRLMAMWAAGYLVLLCLAAFVAVAFGAKILEFWLWSFDLMGV